MRRILFFIGILGFAFASFAQDNQPNVNLELESKADIQNFEEQAATWQVADVEKLHEENFDFNQKDANGNTVLYYVLSRNPSLEVAQKVIEYGADVNEPSATGMLPLNVATSKANELQLQIMMMKTMGLETKNEKVREQLEKNIFYEMERMLSLSEILIKAGADVNKESVLGTPLMNAVTNLWNVDIVDLLIKSGANINQRDKDGRTALFYAYSSGNDDFVTMLIKEGANVEIMDKDGLTYLEVEKINIE
ncbi:MAG: ankyrin repeat domain-containing protein [Alphaproteobacteria bacterium]|nr:ankyrin repeat domain-containing protein [Alphaproteobacteria bacterium]